MVWPFKKKVNDEEMLTALIPGICQLLKTLTDVNQGGVKINELIFESFVKEKLREEELIEILRLDSNSERYKSFVLKSKMEMVKDKAKTTFPDIPLEYFISEEYIKKGWRLLQVFPKRVKIDLDLVTYVLGRYEMTVAKVSSDAILQQSGPESK